MTYSPNLGRWLQNDPIGFEAGDPNLYRFEGNGPANETDPTGLKPGDYGSWDFWANARRKLEITGSTDEKHVSQVLESLDTTYRLDVIPWVDARKPIAYNVTVGTLAPPEMLIKEDRSGPYMGHPNARTGDPSERRCMVTSAQLARINIRANLLNLKQRIVTEVFLMLMKEPPKHPSIKDDSSMDTFDRNLKRSKEYEEQANLIADAYIRAVDQFLKDHPGAGPMLGSRNMVADKLGIQNEKNAPWCADWTPAMTSALIDVRSNYVSIQWGQWKKSGIVDLEHNFAIVKPFGHQTQFLPALDSIILLFDPWRDLLPRVYHPTNEDNFAPTNIY